MFMFNESTLRESNKNSYIFEITSIYVIHVYKYNDFSVIQLT